MADFGGFSSNTYSTPLSYLRDAPYPLDKEKLITYAHEKGAGSTEIYRLEKLPESTTFRKIEEVEGALANM